MQLLIRTETTKVQVREAINNGESYEVVLKNKFSCKEIELSAEGFICRDEAFLLITTEVPCGFYTLIFGNYKIPVQVK